MLFEPLQMGALRLPNRVLMAPLTRARAGRTHIANALMAEHYAQRASAGLLIAEATMVAADGCAFTGEPGIYSEACVAGWRLVTDAVHAAGGRIVLQIWHPGRAAHSSLNDGVQPVSSGEVAIQGLINTPAGKQPYEVPRRLRDEELPGIVEQFRLGTRRAMAAGFDGVQIHGAHGYLIDQFLRDGVNDRQPPYGGGLANRLRLLLDVIDAAIEEAGADRVGLRISPLVGAHDLRDSDPEALVRAIACALDVRSIGHLELRHGDQAAPAERAIAAVARQHFRGTLLLNGGFDAVSAEAALQEGRADAIVFGRAFIANPDLVDRLREGVFLADYEPSRLYGGGAEGYTDYPLRPLAEAV
ncbi:MAG: alkene reductase [Burkholderiales bacterium]|nr:alkene reductase [Burkholderiales bacterium]